MAGIQAHLYSELRKPLPRPHIFPKNRELNFMSKNILNANFANNSFSEGSKTVL